MTNLNKRKFKIKNPGYANRSGQYRHDNAGVAFDKPGRVKKEEKEDK